MKPQRKTITDALAEIAAQAPDATPVPAARDHVARDHDPRPAHSPEVQTGAQAPRDRVTTHHLSAGTDEDGYRLRVRREKPHASIYAHPKVFAAIRDIANAQRRKPHDLYVEGLRLMLAQYGLDFDELDGRK
jgi:hypothetical protein